MAKIVIRGIKPWDGEYELSGERAFNAREWRCIKKIAGYMPATLAEGFEGDDPDLYVALAVIAMTRAGKVERNRMMDVCEELSEVPFDGASITIVGDAVEEPEDVVPLELTPTHVEPSHPNSLSSVG